MKVPVWFTKRPKPNRNRHLELPVPVSAFVLRIPAVNQSSSLKPAHYSGTYQATFMGDTSEARDRSISGSQLRLVTSDDEEFNVEWDVIKQSRLIEGMIEDIGGSTEVIPLPNVSSEVMKKILEWCKHHRYEPPYKEELEDSDSSGAAQLRLQNIRDLEVPEWDSKWILFGSDELLFKVLMAANYLDIRLLLNIGIKTIANMLKGKTTQEMRERFKIVNDFTPEEEEEIRKQIEWADDG